MTNRASLTWLTVGAWSAVLRDIFRPILYVCISVPAMAEPRLSYEKAGFFGKDTQTGENRRWQEKRKMKSERD